MATQVSFKNQPGLLPDSNKPVPDYITDLNGKRYPLTSIDSAYAMANISCQMLALGAQLNEFLRTSTYAAAPNELKGAIQATKLTIANIQAQNFICLAMLFRFYSLRPGFQTDLMRSHNWRLDRVTAPDAAGAWTSFSIVTTDDWVRVADFITKDVLRQSVSGPTITLTPQGATMQGMGIGINLLAPVVLTAAESGTAAAATTGAVASAQAAGTAVVGGGGSVAAALIAEFAWPITVCVVGVVGVYTLGNVTTYTVDKGAALMQERAAAEGRRADIAVQEQVKAAQAYQNAKTPEEKEKALAMWSMWDERIDKNAEQAGGLGNSLFGGSFDFQKIAYTVIGLGALYAGLQLFLKNRPAPSASAAD